MLKRTCCQSHIRTKRCIQTPDIHALSLILGSPTMHRPKSKCISHLVAAYGSMFLFEPNYLGPN